MRSQGPLPIDLGLLHQALECFWIGCASSLGCGEALNGELLLAVVSRRHRKPRERSFPHFGVGSAGANKTRDAPTELDRIALYLDQRSSERRLFLTLGQCLFEQAVKTVLLSLNTQEILNLLTRPRAWNLGLEEGAPHDLVALEATRRRQALEASDMLLGKPHGESMFQIPHTKIINIAIALSRKNVTSDARISRRR